MRQENLSGLTEVIEAFMQCKDVRAAKRCVRVFVRHDERGAPILVFGWAPN